MKCRRLVGGGLLLLAGRLDAQIVRCSDLPCDTVQARLRSQTRVIRLRLDSLVHEITEEPVGSPDRVRIDKALLSALSDMADAMPLGLIETRTVLEGNESVRRLPARPLAAMLPRGWMGINTDAVPHQEFVSDSGLVIRYFEHPAVISVDPDSPAERSGILRGDLLLSYNGADVTDHPINLTVLLQPRQHVAVRVRRGSDVKEFGVMVGKASEGSVFHRDDAMPPAKRVFIFAVPPDGVFEPALVGANGVLGALLSSMDAESGRAYGVQSGLLVNSAPEGTPARESGLRGGDVILRAAGEPVVSLAQFRMILSRHVADRELAVDVQRERKVVPVVLTWSAK